ncbi:MAG: PucR family transcriptional regulator ligand-binding domain-containing protein [Nitrospiraceae bacterium]|nr:PucR family transcriptional regulator ligand-binding domain-containing protein [Nitrospiraceae bacterium]
MSENRASVGTRLTLREVLAQPSLGLRLVTSDEDALNRLVTGAHSFEISRPTRWFSAHWIALTTGLRLKGRPAEQRELVRELHNAGISALGFALDVNFRAVPPGLLEAAEEFGLPVFTVPFATGFAEIIAFVNQALLSPNVNALRRFVSAQDYLLDSLLSADPVAALLERLAPLVPAAVALLEGGGGEVLAASETMDARTLAEVRECIERQSPSPATPAGRNAKRAAEASDFGGAALTQLIEFDAGHGPGLALAVQPPSRPAMWLALVGTADSGEADFQLALPLVRSAGHMLSIALETRSDRLAERRAQERALVAEVCGLRAAKAPAAKSARPQLERLFSLGIDFSAPAWVVCAAASAEVGDPEREFGARLDELENHPPLIWDTTGEVLVAIVQCDEEALAKELGELAGGLYHIGVSSACQGYAALPGAYREANAALAELLANPRSDAPPGMLLFDEASMTTWLMAQVDLRKLAEKQERRRAHLTVERHAIVTLRSYLECNLDINLAAAQLGIHPNSMRYRLHKVRETQGVRLEDFAELVDLYLALKLLPGG